MIEIIDVDKYICGGDCYLSVLRPAVVVESFQE